MINDTDNSGGGTKKQEPLAEDEVLIEQSNSTRPRKPKFKRNVSIVIGIFLIWWLLASYNTPNEQQSPVKITTAQFDTRLLSCNRVTNAGPSEDFDICKSLADDGAILAKRRMVWVYSRSNEYADLSEAFKWLNSLKNIDRNANLLAFAFANLLSNSPESKEKGELGIKRFANRNFPPANLLLASMYALEENTIEQSSNPLWLIERAFEEDPSFIDPTVMATIYTNGYISPKSLSKATAVLKETAQNDYPNGTNNVAWFLSTIENNPLTMPSYAVELASRVVEDPNFSRNFTYIDTLAAAHAANNDFDKAINIQKRAITEIESAELSKERKVQLLKEFNARLNKYENFELSIESELIVEKNAFFERLKTRVINRLLNSFYNEIKPPAPQASEDS